MCEPFFASLFVPNHMVGSIRAELLKNKEKSGMVAVNIASNGVHMSAGPLEGLVELQRFLSDWDAGIFFGHRLVSDSW